MRSIPPVWLDAAPPPYPHLPGGTVVADVAVIGAGFTGLSAAYHLLRRRPGMRLLVLEAGRIGAGASGRTTGLLGPGVGQSLEALVRRVGAAGAQALYRATLAAVGSVCDLVHREKIDCDLERSGQLVVARGPGGRARPGRLHALLTAMELPGEALTDDALSTILRLHTNRDTSDGPAALRLPNAGTLHPVKLLAGLAERVTALGGVLHEGLRVRRLIPGKPVRLEMDSGEVLADEVVVGTAGFTPDLGLFRGRLLPVQLQAVVTEPLTGRARDSIGWLGREGVLDSRRPFNYFRLTADDRILFGGGRPRYRWGGRTQDRDDTSGVLSGLVRELTQTFPPEANVRAIGGWTGVIGYTLDALPAIARWLASPAVVHAVGWCGHGVALSLASGEWVARILCDGAASDDLPWFRARLPGVPGELLRWLGFHATVRWMSLRDRWG